MTTDQKRRSRNSRGSQSYARQLRNNPTRTFQKLWQVLRCKRLGYKFTRRKGIKRWIPDFYCPFTKLFVEIDYPSDGERYHDHQIRDATIASEGYRIIRIKAKRIHNDMDGVIKEIKTALTESGKEPPYQVVL